MLGQVAGYRRQVKPWMRWLDSIKDATGQRLEALKEQYKVEKNDSGW
jgi:protein-disulfide isomerase